ncbi:class I SAM-dependent methyltransferase [Ramlibacter sp.]|uniref:class I SAM-dependent methyltransferase n=1 Tax=Ramlibacter sp. TaxID=1917967 RepID=UPI0025DB474F|nr:class I SAM-dependent methyltransferase [Ramlibacter sp.]
MDWSSAATQELRFRKLLLVCRRQRRFSLNDLGCGYGALFGYLWQARPASVDYLGIDLAKPMIEAARRLWRAYPEARFRVSRHSPRIADYCVASGTFNVKLDAARPQWEALVRRSLAVLARTSRYGFAFNLLTPEPTHLPQAPQLYRTDPQPWVAFCEETLGGRCELIAGYGLNEFTLLVHRG